MQTGMNVKNKRIVVVGLGLTGRACVSFLVSQQASVIALDSRTGIDAQVSVPAFLGPFELHHFNDADMVVISPGVDPSDVVLSQIKASGIEMIGDVELFARFNTAQVIAITGSNGKSTVTTLVADMLRADGRNAIMGGNIGKPVLELLELEADILVLELSSFQLETVASLKPVVATVLNLSDDHLDRHGTMEAYRQAKLRIYDNAEFAVINREERATHPRDSLPSTSFGLTETDCGLGYVAGTQTITRNGEGFVSQAECALVGRHNLLNVQAAIACAQRVGCSDQAMLDAIRNFKSLPHRFQRVSSGDGVLWINDSKATNVGAAVAAIEGLQGSYAGQLILIAGGDAKGADLTPLERALQQWVDVLITLGQDGDRIAALKPDAIPVATLAEAVNLAHQKARHGDVVLLSPACASIDMFASYQQRGDEFTHLVQEIAA